MRDLLRVKDKKRERVVTRIGIGGVSIKNQWLYNITALGPGARGKSILERMPRFVFLLGKEVD